MIQILSLDNLRPCEVETCLADTRLILTNLEGDEGVTYCHDHMLATLARILDDCGDSDCCHPTCPSAS